MKRRNLGLGVGIATLGSSMFLLAGSASAAAPTTEACKVISLPGFTLQGEFASTGTVADVIQVECNPEVYGTKRKLKIEAYQVFSRCEHKVTWFVPNSPTEGITPLQASGFIRSTGPGVAVELDPDGNATVALLAGPNCTPNSDNMITVHQEETPFESFTTSFAILPPAPTREGVEAKPERQVEDDFSSAFATIIQAEFPGIAEERVRIASEELFHRCRVFPHLRWILINGSERIGVSEVTGVPLDNDGNGFVIVIGDSSCVPGRSLIEADLEESPFTTLKPAFFTVEPPQTT
jgi:hypothetical protein